MTTAGFVMKATKPDWFTDIVAYASGGVTARARHSSLALAVVSPRCGAGSPARALGPHAVKQLWEDWGEGTKRVVVVEADVARGSAAEPSSLWKYTVTFMFGVSALLGLMGDMQVAQNSVKWIDQGRFITHDDDNDGQVSLVVVDTCSGKKSVVKRGGVLPNVTIGRYCANAMWAVKLEGVNKAVAITKLTTEYPECPVFTVQLPGYRGELVCFNQVISSEAAIAVRSPNTTVRSIVVIDVAKSFETKSLHVVTTTALDDSLNSRDCVVQNLIVMQNSMRQKVYIVLAHTNNASWEIGWFVAIVDSNGQANRLYSDYQYFDPRNGIYQVSSSLFLVEKSTCLELWDLSNTKVLPLMCHTGYSRNTGGVLCGSGLLALIEPNQQRLQVIEMPSQHIVVEFGLKGEVLHSLQYNGSFIFSAPTSHEYGPCSIDQSTSTSISIRHSCNHGSHVGSDQNQPQCGIGP
ncbi:hypothetical protein Pelo_8872 [Pelomyxa schiedti]|nr:hypothetical protein Pelo_8872 [Pelomyxa schiedti]